MSKIIVLDQATANQIAAGEVVERPSSVVKELVENSIDASATRIDIDLEHAGRGLIRVSDNGLGMDAQDLTLSIKRHATSKLSNAAALNQVSTFGFRGEALPSIASVSRFEISSRAQGSNEAYLFKVEGGQEAQIQPASMSHGTQVLVRDLFYNTPARLKFLKSDTTELSRIEASLRHLALAHPQIAFKLRIDGQVALDYPRAQQGAAERVGQILGSGFLGESVTFDETRGELRVWGWAGKPALARGQRSGQYLLVNRRAVEHRQLGFLLAQAYGSLLPHGRHPLAVIFLELPPDLVDVNVHPAKREVRFRDERMWMGLLHNAISDSLPKDELLVRARLDERNMAYTQSFQPATLPYPQAAPLASAYAAPWLVPHIHAAAAPHQTYSGQVAYAPVPERQDWPTPLAQLHRSYILAQDSEGLVLADQHAAHERVLYEKFCLALEKRDIKSQRLLLPQKLSLPKDQARRLNQWLEPLTAMGLELQDLGEGVFYIQSIPNFLKNVQVTALLQDLLEDLDPALDKDPLGGFRSEVAAQMACRAAVKAGDPLTLDEMQHLMADLAACKVPWSCPHGRPPLVRLSLAELERYFQRR